MEKCNMATARPDAVLDVDRAGNVDTVMAELSHVGLFYQERASETEAIRDLSFRVYEGEFVSIVGPSGCGKTSVLSLLAGLMEPSFGTVCLTQANDAPAPKVGYMLQRDCLLDWRTVEENVLLGLEVKRMVTPERRDYALSLLDRYGLNEFRLRHPRQLSGGMRQKVALIRTLAFEPTLLLLDEPFSALDFQTRLRLSDEVYGIIRRENKTAVLVTHDISEAVAMSDRVLVFSERPARLFSEHVSTFLPDECPLSRRSDARFSPLFNAVWKELNHCEAE